MKKCFLDMDGVLVDFVRGACEFHGIPYAYDDPALIHEWDFVRHSGIPEKDFWEPLDEEFWANLKPMPDAFEILATVYRYFKPSDVCILSSPSKQRGCVAGKLRWIEKHIPQFRRQFLFGPRKEFCASQFRLLIDDADHNVEAFWRAGGQAVLVPRPWNSSAGDDVQTVLINSLNNFVRREPYAA